MLLLGVVLEFWLAPGTFLQNKEAGENIRDESIQGDDAVREYRWFRQQWHDIQAHKNRIDNIEQEHRRFHQLHGNDTDDWSRQAYDRHEDIHMRLTGTRNQLETYIAEYNARSDDATRALFKCGLPYNVDEKLFISDGTGVEYTSQEAMNRTPPEDPSQCKYASAPTASGN